MKKLLAIVLLCALMLSVMVSFSSCVILDKINEFFGGDEPDVGGGEGEGDGTGEGDVPGEEDDFIFSDDQPGTSDGINLPIIPVVPDTSDSEGDAE